MIYIIIFALLFDPPLPIPHGATEYLVSRVRVSHYSPALGGINCGAFVNGVCTSRMASGHRWQAHIAAANTAACPRSLPFDSFVRIGGVSFRCLDRGGRIVVQRNGVIRLDVLAERVTRFEGRTWKAWVSVGERRNEERR